MRCTIKLFPFLFILLSGCTVVPASINAIDGVTPREPILHPSLFVLTINNTDENSATDITIQCEHFYQNSGFSTRGNMWVWRYYKELPKYTFKLSDNRLAELVYPKCIDLTGGSKYSLRESNNKFTYIYFHLNDGINRMAKFNKKTRQYIMTSMLQPKEKVIIPLGFMLKKI